MGSRSKELEAGGSVLEDKAMRASVNRTVATIEVPSLNQQIDTSSQISDYALSTKARGQFEEISNEIFYLEREIADLNRQYKDLLGRSQETTNASMLGNIKIDLSNIARLLEEKSERLFELKKQQQFALKSV